MDERHWWIAQRIAEAFSFDSTSGFLEKFITEPDNMDKVNSFLCANGSNKLFAASMRGEELHTAPNTSSTTSGRSLHLIESVIKLPKEIQENLDTSIILYFLRHDTTQEVSQQQIYKYVFCGEIKNVSQILFNVYNDLFMNAFNSGQTWSEQALNTAANSTVRVQSIRNMEKYINGLNELSVANSSQKNSLLKKVDSEAFFELKQARISPDSPIIKYCEDLASEWVLTIENILSDICDEK
jgi:hypothetical protein